MIISWNVTRACNLKCLHCYRDAGTRDADELDTARGLRLLDEMRQAHFRIVVFSGGEPLLRGDIYELISFAARSGLRAVLGTNGTLIDGAGARRLFDAGLSRAGISLDSFGPSAHDAFRRQRGAWQRSVDAMIACRDAGVEFQTHTTVTRSNWTEIEKITDLAAGLGAKAHHVFFLVPTGRGKDLKDAAIGRDEYRILIERIVAKQSETGIELKCVCAPQFVPVSMMRRGVTRFSRGCLAGISYCCILPNGDVHPCPYMPIKTGNVRETPFDDIWNGSALFNELRSLKYGGSCGACGHKETCGGCRARAFYDSGDSMGEDPSCVFADKEASRC